MDPEHCVKLPCFLQTLTEILPRISKNQNILCEIPTLHLQYILFIDSRHASRLHLFSRNATALFLLTDSF